MSKKKIFSIIAVVLIAVGLVAAFYNAAQRAVIEAAHKETEIVMEWNQVIDSAQRENSSVAKVLEDLKGQSVGGIFMKEASLQDLVNEGKVSAFSGLEFLSLAQEYGLDPQEVNRDHSYLVFSDQAEMVRVQKQIVAKVKGAYCAEIAGRDGVYILQTSVPDNDFASLGLGFSAANLQLVADAGMNLAVQVRFWGACDENSIDAVLADLKAYPVVAVGFNDAYVPGYNNTDERWKELKEYWAQSLLAMDTDLMTLEFFEQAGLTNLAQVMEDQVLRCHAISETDAAALKPEALVDRFTLAASERNMKLLLLRLPYKVQVNQQRDLLNDLGDSLWNKEVMLQAPSAPKEFNPQPWTLLLCGLGVIGGAWLLMGQLRFRLGWKAVISIILLLGLAGLLVLGQTSMLQKAFALLAVLVFPTMSIIRFLPRERQKLPKALLSFVLMSAVSLIGAVLMVGFMADGTFMLKLQSFAGVKVAHLIPLILVAIWVLFLADREKSPMLSFKEVMNNRISIGMVVLGGILIAAIAVYLTRTGNDNTAVSDTERAFRAAMDALMGVRPRTKEFLLGHPLMLLMCWWGYRNHYYLPVLLLGAIGQVSMVNTFAHIHTPLLVSGLRTMNGLILGIIAGLILIAIIYLIVRQRNKKRAAE